MLKSQMPFKFIRFIEPNQIKLLSKFKQRWASLNREDLWYFDSAVNECNSKAKNVILQFS